ncbi:MAG: SDR family oxidoreductase [Ilumatobacteraceae bacterium]|nr:SDR family oxidoreductase [Ilumatobacteraceae bacterium]
MRLQGKVAIVTGAGPNIGAGLAEGLAKEGAIVACNDLSAETAVAALARVEAVGGQGMAIPGDVTDEAFATQAIAEVAERFGHVDILINSAVQFNLKGLLTMPVDEYRKQVDIILTGAFIWTKHVAETMIENGTKGSIINILSTAAWQGHPGNIGYCTGKSGLINFTKSAAMELAEYGIRVNTLTPTVTFPRGEDGQPQTLADVLRARGIDQDAMGAEKYPMEFDGLPLGRILTPEDYVPAAVLLASDEAAMMTGIDITVDGGALAKYWPWTPST